MKSSRPRIPPVLLLWASLAAASALLPGVYTLIRTWQAPSGQIAATLLQKRTFGLLVNTLGLTAAVTASAAVLGVSAAWFTWRSDLPLGRVWVVLSALPLVVPSYLGGYTFVAGLGPRGLIQGWLEPLGVDRLPEIYGFGGAWLVLTLFTYPYVFLTARAALQRSDPALEEAALTLGRSRFNVFRSVIIPQMRPAVAAGSLLVALYTLHDFGAVSLLRFDSFTRAIYVAYESSFDRSAAAILSLVLVAVTLLVTAGEIRLRPGADIYKLHGGSRRNAGLVKLGRYKWPLFAAFCLVAALALLLPLGVIGLWLFQGIKSRAVLGVTFQAAGNSLHASALGTGLALAAAWPLSVLSARFGGRLSRNFEKAAFVGYALPGVVVALSLVFFGTRVAPALYQTRTMLAFAYMVLFLPQAVGALKTSFLQVNPALDEAARTLGQAKWRRMKKLTLPLVRPGVVAAASLVFLTAMKELPATLLLSPIGFSSLATRVWSATSAASFARAAPPALALLALSSVPLAILLLRERDPGLQSG